MKKIKVPDHDRKYEAPVKKHLRTVWQTGKKVWVKSTVRHVDTKVTGYSYDRSREGNRFTGKGPKK